MKINVNVPNVKTFLSGMCISLIVLSMSVVSQNVLSADNQGPMLMLKGVTDQVMQGLKANREELQKNPNRVYGIVNQQIVPHVDFVEMGRWVVGRNAWNSASPAQQQIFVKEFRTLLLRSYAKSLLAYTDQTIEFLPNRNTAGQGRTQVSSVIKGSPRGDIRIDYRLIQTDNVWKVYDIVIEGVSLVQGYRAQFAETLKSGGMEAVVRSMQQHNGSSAAK